MGSIVTVVISIKSEPRPKNKIKLNQASKIISVHSKSITVNAKPNVKNLTIF